MWQGMAHGIALGPIGSSVAGALSKTVFKEADNGNSTGFFFRKYTSRCHGRRKG